MPTDRTIYVWNTEKSKLQGSVKTTNMTNSLMSQISCNPYQSGYQLCLIGNGIMRLYKYADGTFKVLSQVKSDKVSCFLTTYYIFCTEFPGRI